MATTAIAKAKEITPSSAIVKGAVPPRIRVAGTEPTPMNTSTAVPISSARSFWGYVFSDKMSPPDRENRRASHLLVSHEELFIMDERCSEIMAKEGGCQDVARSRDVRETSARNFGNGYD